LENHLEKYDVMIDIDTFCKVQDIGSAFHLKLNPEVPPQEPTDLPLETTSGDDKKDDE
jgi:hypothetical protein